jgi:hypothetical protein
VVTGHPSCWVVFPSVNILTVGVCLEIGGTQLVCVSAFRCAINFESKPELFCLRAQSIPKGLMACFKTQTVFNLLLFPGLFTVLDAIS